MCRKKILTGYVIILFSMLSSGCVPVFSELQSARLAGKNNIEITPDFSASSFHNEGSSEHIQNHFGFQAGYGISQKIDFRVRYERINVDIIHPTLLFTFSGNKNLELNTSVKALIPINSNDDVTLAFNFSPAISTNLNR